MTLKQLIGKGYSKYKLAFEYDITDESKRSYYDLFDAAGISWKKTTSLNPKADEKAVAAKKRVCIVRSHQYHH